MRTDSRGAAGFVAKVSALTAAVACTALFVVPAAASATSFPVTTTANGGAGSLRAAIASANSNPGKDTIPINTTGVLTLQSALPNIAGSVDITGPGATKFMVSGADQYQPFLVLPAATVAISGLTIAHGACDGSPCSIGAGILNEGDLTLNRTVVTQNTVTISGGTDAFATGGGIYNTSSGVLHVVLSTISQNTADSEGGTSQNAPSGGGIANFGTVTLDRSTVASNHAVAHAGAGGTVNVFGGGISNIAVLTITRSTISNNTASANDSTIANSANGGGVANGNAPAQVDVSIDRSTIADNVVTASGPGGSTNITQGGGFLSSGGTFSLRSSTLAHNSAATGGNIDSDTNLPIQNSIVSNPEVGANCIGPPTSQGYNISDDSSCSFGMATDQTADPLLAPSLNANGGPTKTYALMTGSPAVDKGQSAVGETIDQRGKPRPHDFANIANASGGDGTDIGALEAQPANTTIDSGPGGTTSDPTPTFSFHATEAGSTFECKVDGQSFASCTSPSTLAHLADGAHTFQVRAKDPAGNPDPSPASRSFTVKTAEVKVSGSTVVVTAAGTSKDNFRISQPAPDTIRVTDAPSGSFTGSGIHVGAGCTTSGDSTANCDAAGVNLLKVTAASAPDKVTNLTSVPSTLLGGPASDILIGGAANDSLDGGTGADTFKGMNGNDKLLAHDLASDTAINCDGGTTPGGADKANLDLLPKDPDSIVHGCETKSRN